MPMRVADAHEVAQAVAGQQLVHQLDGGEHLGAPLPDREAADGVGVEADREQLGGRAAAQRLVDAALDDADEELVVAVCARLAGRRPARRARDGGGHLVARRRARRALVEAHDDVGAERLLRAPSRARG